MSEMEDNKPTDAIIEGSDEQSYDGPVVPVENVAKPKPKAKPRAMANTNNNNQYEGHLVTDPPGFLPNTSGLTMTNNCDVTRRHSGSSVETSNGIAEGADNDASYSEEMSAATDATGNDAVVKVKSKTKPLAPPRPNRAFQKSLISGEMGGSLPKLDESGYAGQSKPRPVPKPKPRPSLTPNIPRSPSYEEAVEDGVLLENMNLKTSAGVKKTGTLVRSLSRSADDLLTLQFQAEQSGANGFTEMSALESGDRQVLKPSRAAPPRPLPKPQSSKIQEAMQLADRLHVTSSPDVSISQPSTEEQVPFSDNSTAEPRSAGVEMKDRFGNHLPPRSANSFRIFSFLTRTDSGSKSIKRSSVFYQQESPTASPISGSQSMPGYLNQLSHLNCEEEDSFDESAEDVEISNQKTPADVGVGDLSRRDSGTSTSVLRRGSDSTASFSSDVNAGLSLSHSGTGLNDSFSPQTFRDSAASSPASQAEFSFEGMDVEARAARLEALRKKAYNVAKEIVDTERSFVEHLILVNGSFREAVTKAVDSGGRPVITEDVLSQIIRYLPQLQNLSSNLLADLEDRLAKWALNPTIADIFVKKGPFLKMYTDYIRDYEEMVAILDDSRARNPDFNKAVTEFEQLPACRGLGIRHHMLKPIQRIPQYRLLLKEYLKQQTRDSPDYENTKAALKIVSEVAEHANQRMKYLEESKHLKEIQAALGNQFEVIKPGRILVKEGVLNKLSRKEMQPRMFFLFNDVLLYTTPTGAGYKLNNVLPLTSMRVSRPANEEFQNEFSIITTQRSFTIQARSEQERVEWLTTLETAIKAALHRKLTHTQSKHLPADLKVEVDTSKIKIGHVAPVWIPDDRVTKCALCAADFSITFRRHHCRGCGKVVCGSCSDYRAPLRYLDYRADRVCSECFDTLERALVKMSDTEYVTCPGSTMNGILIKYTKEDLRALFRGYPLHRSRSSAKSTVLSEVSANDKTVDASGYLKQWKNKSWKRMWFVVKNMVLYWYKASEDTAAEGSMPLIGYDVLPFNTKFQDVDKDFLFELHHKNLQSIIFRAENVQSRDRWMVTMRQATVPR